ncbi:MAG: hypothetical protein WCD37_20325 [Chloroflexia bacterium]
MNEQLRALRATPNANHPTTANHPITEDDPLDDRPRSVYELITRRMLDELRADLEEIKGRVNTLLWLTIGAVLIDVIMRIVK